jgi:hypothetical protein
MKNYTTVNDMLDENPEFKDCKIFYSEFYKNIVTYVAYKKNKKLVVKYVVEYRDDIPIEINLKILIYADILDIVVNQLSHNEIQQLKKEYENELKLLKLKYDFN